MKERLSSGAILLEGGRATFAFDPRRGALCAITAGGYTHACRARWGNWRLVLAGDGAECVLGPGDFERVACRPAGSSLTCEWFKPKRPEVPPELRVRVAWRAGAPGLTGTFRCDRLGPPRRLKRIEFPVVAFRARGQTALVLPLGLGRLLREAGTNGYGDPQGGGRITWDYLHSATMQFCACLVGERGLYFDTRDPAGYLKTYSFEKAAPGWMVYTGRHPAPQPARPASSYRLPYPVTLAAFEGGWYEAARIYRRWARRQRWAASARANRTRATAQRVRQLALWIWNRGRIAQAVPAVEQLAARLGLPVGLDWYWWHRGPYDSEYPRYLPPREGVERFTDAVRGLREKGIFTQVYVNGLMWDQDDESWNEGGRQSVVIKEDGEPLSGVFNTYLGHRLAYMCGAAPMFRETIVGLARSVRALGLDGLYLDVIATASGSVCYNPAHGHPPGGGTYQIEGFRRLLEQVREACPDLALSSESCGEVYMDLLDTGIMLDPSWERFGLKPYEESIPLFPAVYHDCFPLFGNYALADGVPPYDPLWPPEGRWRRDRNWAEVCPDQFFLEIARNVVWGMQPTVANVRAEHLASPDFAAERRFLEDAVRFYDGHRAFLLAGTMLAPGRLAVDATDVRFLCRTIFTKEGQQSVQTRRLPRILHACWRADDGRRRLVLANYTREEAAYRYEGGGQCLSGTVAGRSLACLALPADAHAARAAASATGR